MKIGILIILLSTIIPLIGYITLWIFLSIRPKFKVDKRLTFHNRIKINNDFYKIDDNWLRKNEYGLWDLFLTKSGIEGGIIYGKLCKELIDIQEEYFIEEIKRIIPSHLYTFFLKIVIGWINRKIENYIPQEYLLEIYGISNAASSKYKYITNNYQRYLNYHAANDIGHTVEDLNMVACTSFGVWNTKSEDGSLLIGRNFDFYFGNKFGKNKTVCFFKPDLGHPFVMISWAGMIGAVSGMNLQGLTLTINTAKSNKPSKARTPLCIIGRSVLQYASTIDEAYQIIKKAETFISASFLIASSKENKAIVIEKSINKTIFFNNSNNDFISSTNHFQSEDFKEDALNKESIENSSSLYRLNRTNELINNFNKISVEDVACILRDKKGINNMDIGIGNEKAINQLIAHHSIIFKPSELKFWISTQPYQMGEFVCYDLNKAFTNQKTAEQNSNIYVYEYNIKAANSQSLIETEKYAAYRAIEIIIEDITKKKCEDKLLDKDFDYFIALNPMLYKTYLTLANYYYSKKNFKKAIDYYKKTLTKEVASNREIKFINNRIAKCKIKYK